MGETPAILAEGLVKTYGTTQALAGLDLTVPAGTVYGLLGPNGAGKTTAVRVFSTLLRPNRGRAQVLGHDVVTEAAQVRRMIGLTGQYAALDEYLTGRANLVMIGQLSRLTADAARRRADEMLERFDLTEAGTQKRLAVYLGPIARVIARRIERLNLHPRRMEQLRAAQKKLAHELEAQEGGDRRRPGGHRGVPRGASGLRAGRRSARSEATRPKPRAVLRRRS